MSKVCVPIDPVDPSKEIFFTFPFPNSNANSSGVGVAVPGQHAPYRDSLFDAIAETRRWITLFEDEEEEVVLLFAKEEEEEEDKEALFI
jgi:hypothetical protein